MKISHRDSSVISKNGLLIIFISFFILGTPRVITNNANITVWKWNNTDSFSRNLSTTQIIEYNKSPIRAFIQTIYLQTKFK